MKLRYLTPLFLSIAVFIGCKPQTCHVRCNGSIYIVAVGFTRAELAHSILNTYDNSRFNAVLTTQKLDSVWAYPAPNDTTTDTLMFRAISLSGGGTNNGYELVLPVVGSNYQVTDMVVGGDLSEEQVCDYGDDPSPGYCIKGGLSLTSYLLNGSKVTLTPVTHLSSSADDSCFIYIVK